MQGVDIPLTVQKFTVDVIAFYSIAVTAMKKNVWMGVEAEFAIKA